MPAAAADRSGDDAAGRGAPPAALRDLCAACGYPMVAPGACCSECGGTARVPPMAGSSPMARATMIASIAAIAAVFAGELTPRLLGWTTVLGLGVGPATAQRVAELVALAGALVAGGMLAHAVLGAARGDARLRRRIAVLATVLAAITAACVTMAPYMLARAGPRPQDDPVVVLWSSLRQVLPSAALDLWLGVAAGALGLAMRRDAPAPSGARSAARAAGTRLLATALVLELLVLAHAALIAGNLAVISAVGGLRLVARWLVLPFALVAAAELLRRVPAPAWRLRCRRATFGVATALAVGMLLQLAALLGALPRTPWIGWTWWVVDGLVIAASAFAAAGLLGAWSILARTDRPGAFAES